MAVPKVVRTEISKVFAKPDLEMLQNRYRKMYGTPDALAQRASVARCTQPDFTDELMIWRAIQTEGCQYRETVIHQGADVLDALTHRRVELLQFLATKRPRSIRELAASLKRNYKNVYDDLLALCRVDLVELSQQGRKLVPSTPVEKIAVTLDK